MEGGQQKWMRTGEEVVVDVSKRKVIYINQYKYWKIK
jgi:hypothetical protein